MGPAAAAGLAGLPRKKSNPARGGEKKGIGAEFMVNRQKGYQNWELFLRHPHYETVPFQVYFTSRTQQIYRIMDLFTGAGLLNH